MTAWVQCDALAARGGGTLLQMRHKPFAGLLVLLRKLGLLLVSASRGLDPASVAVMLKSGPSSLQVGTGCLCELFHLGCWAWGLWD